MGCETRARFLATYNSSVKLFSASVADLNDKVRPAEYMVALKRAEQYRQQCTATLLALQAHIDQHDCGRIADFEFAESA